VDKACHCTFEEWAYYPEANHPRTVAAAIIQTLDSLHLKHPEVGPDKLKELAAARAALVK
jgi:hypothetical protein